MGTTAVFKYDHDSGNMKEISVQFKNISAAKDKQPPCCPHGSLETTPNCSSESMASGDFDGDLIADHIILTATKMLLYFSTDRPTGALPYGATYIGAEIVLPNSCGSAWSVRVIDLDNDGKEEILVMCGSPGTFLVYARGNTKNDCTLQNGCNNKDLLGALVDARLGSVTEDDAVNVCSLDSFTWPRIKRYDNLASVPISTEPRPVPTFLLCQEFLDALPVHSPAVQTHLLGGHRDGDVWNENKDREDDYNKLIGLLSTLKLGGCLL